MGDTLAAALAKPMGVDYLTPLQKWQELHQAQAQTALTQQQTGLVGQQVQGADIQNQLARLNLGLRTSMVAPFLPGGAAGPGAAPGQGGAQQPTSYLPAAPTDAGGAPGPQGGASAAAGEAPASGGAPTAATHSSGMPPSGQPIGEKVGPYGAVQTMYGVPLPAGQTMAVLSAADPSKALQSAMEARRQRLFELMSQPDWQQGVTQAYQEGWMDPQHYQAMVGHPEIRQAALAGLSTPEGYMNALEKYAGMGMTLDPRTGQPTISGPAVAAKQLSAEAGAAGTAAGSGALVTIEVTKPDGSVVPTQVLPKDVASTLAAFPGSTVAPGAAGMLGNFKNAIFGQESGQGANPKTSSAGAVGGFQIMPATFDQYAKPGEKITNPTDNAAVGQRAIDDLWQKTGGDPMRTAVGYFSGPGNIAPPGSPNPWKNDAVDPNGMKTSDYVKQTMLKMLNAPAPAALVAGSGVPKLTAPATAGMGIASDQIKKDQDTVTASLAAAQSSQQQQTNLIQMRNLGPEINAGSLGEFRQGVQNSLATFAPEAAQSFVKAITGGNIDPSKAGSTQEYVKLALQNSGNAAHANNPSGGLGVTNAYMSAFPGLETQPTAIRDMSNLFLINHQRLIDHAMAQQQFQSQQQQSAVADPRSYKPINNFEASFLKSNAPEVYVGAAAALNQKPYAVWSNGLNLHQQQEALRTMWRADPTAVILDSKGNPRYNPALAQQ